MEIITDSYKAIIRFFKGLITGVNNLIYWFPVIFADRYYDHSFIYELLIHKLKRDAVLFKKNNIYIGVDYDVGKINLCVSLLEKVKEEFYKHEYVDYEDSSSLDIFYNKYPRIYEKILKEERPEGFIAYCIAWHNHERARKLLFLLLEKHIERWWD
jgi:hypothetical protein